MAFDGIVIANLAHDIKSRLEGGKINKIAQPEKDELLFTIKHALDIYFNHRDSWARIIQRAMKKDFSWKASAQEYVRLYEGLIAQRAE